MTVNLFAAAKKIEIAAPAKGAKKNKIRVETKGMAALRDLKTVIENLTALKEVFEANVKSAMEDHFVDAGVAAKARPDNFEGFEGEATGSCQLKVRSSASALSEDEIARLTAAEIPVETVHMSEEMFGFNNEHIKNPAIMEVLSKVISKAKINGEALPEDLIVVIPARTKTVANDASIEALFKKSQNEVRALLPILTTLAVNPKTNPNIKEAIAAVDSLLTVKEA